LLRFLLALLLCASAGQAQRLPEQVVASGPQGQVVIRRTTQGSQALLVANLDRPRRALVADQSLAAHPMPPIAGRRALLVRGWSGGAGRAGPIAASPCTFFGTATWAGNS